MPWHIAYCPENIPHKHTVELTVEIHKSSHLDAGVQDTVEQTNTFCFSYLTSLLQSTSLPKLIASYID
jgi:hypothetical protein